MRWGVGVCGEVRARRGLPPPTPKTERVYTMKQREVVESRELMDVETGEIIYVGDGEKLVKERQVASEKPAIMKRMGFMKIFLDAAGKIARELSATEIKMIVGLMPYVSYEDCCIRWDGYGEVMDVEDIAEALGEDKKKVYRVIASLEKKGVMGHHVTGSILKGYKGKLRKVYTVNPFVCCRGTKINRAVYEYYHKSGWRTL